MYAYRMQLPTESVGVAGSNCRHRQPQLSWRPGLSQFRSSGYDTKKLSIGDRFLGCKIVRKNYLGLKKIFIIKNKIIKLHLNNYINIF